ncbi:hypothetical protein Fot_14759 [Forsythia ovata]|uniref:Uncharacterized protein n=1 Tax=Forsythia ovata TaxID=205694 RepID=A0ABD1W7L3_9LAMI
MIGNGRKLSISRLVQLSKEEIKLMSLAPSLPSGLWAKCKSWRFLRFLKLHGTSPVSELFLMLICVSLEALASDARISPENLLMSVRNTISFGRFTPKLNGKSSTQ